MNNETVDSSVLDKRGLTTFYGGVQSRYVGKNKVSVVGTTLYIGDVPSNDSN